MDRAMKEGEATAMFEEVLGNYEGKFGKHPVDGALMFEGKDINGHAFRADIIEYENHASIGCEYLEDCMGHYGVGRRGDDLAEVKKVIEDVAKTFKMKRKEFEQLKLW
jgi:hypothetical protein